jgi:phage-related protein
MALGENNNLKPLFWVGSSKKDLLKMPEQVVDVAGYALYMAQSGHKHPNAKPLKGFGSAGVLEVVEDDDGSTYRAVYTVKFNNGVYVLHCFQKKSRKGIETSKQDKDMIEERLKMARLHSEGVEL